MFTLTIKPEWTLAGHVDVGSFSRLFDLATDAFRDGIGLGERYAKAAGCGLFAVEAHLTYRAELRVGDEATVSSRLLGCDAKRIRLFHVMRRMDGAVAATCELMLVHVDRHSGRSAAFAEDARQRLTGRLAEDAEAAVPDEAGRGIRAI